MSAYTEAEAKTKWCAHARVQVERQGYIPGGAAGNNYALAGVNRLLDARVRNSDCLGSGCMAWRWKARFGTDPNNPENAAQLEPTHGYCGLAGRSE